MKIKLFITLITVCFFSSSYAEKGVLNLQITNIEDAKGELCISLYNNAKDFLNIGKELRKIKIKVQNNSVFYTLTNLPSGKYAIGLYHDKNSDGECNRNWLGIPTEGYGFSKNFKPILAAPTFKKVKFIISDKAKHLQIKMINP